RPGPGPHEASLSGSAVSPEPTIASSRLPLRVARRPSFPATGTCSRWGHGKESRSSRRLRPLSDRPPRNTIAAISRGGIMRCLVLASALLAALVAAAAASALPSTLTREFFVADQLQPNGGTVKVSATCNAAATSTISYFASGVAVGPYAGTFTETGSATIGPLTAGQF